MTESPADIFHRRHGVQKRFARIAVEKVSKSGAQARLDLFRVADQRRADGELAHAPNVPDVTRRASAVPPSPPVFPKRCACVWEGARWCAPASLQQLLS